MSSKTYGLHRDFTPLSGEGQERRAKKAVHAMNQSQSSNIFSVERNVASFIPLARQMVAIQECHDPKPAPMMFTDQVGEAIHTWGKEKPVAPWGEDYIPINSRVGAPRQSRNYNPKRKNFMALNRASLSYKNTSARDVGAFRKEYDLLTERSSKFGGRNTASAPVGMENDPHLSLPRRRAAHMPVAGAPSSKHREPVGVDSVLCHSSNVNEDIQHELLSRRPYTNSAKPRSRRPSQTQSHILPVAPKSQRSHGQSDGFKLSKFTKTAAARVQSYR